MNHSITFIFNSPGAILDKVERRIPIVVGELPSFTPRITLNPAVHIKTQSSCFGTHFGHSSRAVKRVVRATRVVKTTRTKQSALEKLIAALDL